MSPSAEFVRARELLLSHRDDYAAAYAQFRWPGDSRFNWARDWFDVYAQGNPRPALWITDDAGSETRLSFAEISDRSSRVARFFQDTGIARGDRILIMLPNVPALWDVVLAAMKIGAVVIPATTQLTRDDIADRLDRGRCRMVITDEADAEKFAPFLDRITLRVVGTPSFDAAHASPAVLATRVDTEGTDPFLLYFTSGTTAKPKLVLHTQHSYPIGHLSTMYWIGLREGDRHLNISSPGWAKHAWSSVFAPWNAGATVMVHHYARFHAPATLDLVVRQSIDTLCAPPTVWRMLILEALAKHPVKLRELVSAGEPLNPEVIEQVKNAWGLTIRDGFGQTETTAQIGNTPGQPITLGAMGRPLPGYEVVLLDHEGREADEGEVALKLDPRPLGLMVGYLDDEPRTAAAMANGYYRTGDEASRDAHGLYHYVGRGDDVFKSSDYRLSPFELESVLIEHPAVAEAAVVPSPDPVRTSVPKAIVAVAPGFTPSRELAHEILAFVRDRVAPYKRVRRLEFAELPKTISGKIRRVQLRNDEAERCRTGVRGPLDFGPEHFGDGKKT